MKGLLDFLLFWLAIGNKYERLKNDPERQDSVLLGVSSLIMSVVGVLSAVGFAYLAFLCFSAEGLTIILTFIFGIVLVLAAAACFFQLLVASVFYAAYQLKLNKRPIGIIALVVSLLMIVAAFVGIIIVITKI